MLDSFTLVSHVPLEGDTKSKREQEYRTRMKRNEVKYAPLQIVQVVSKLGTQQVSGQSGRGYTTTTTTNTTTTAATW